MLRLAEFGLFLLPFVLYVAWRLSGRVVRPALFWVGVAGFVILATLVVWFGLARSLDKTDRYVPAHVENGRIVPGHGEAVGQRDVQKGKAAGH